LVLSCGKLQENLVLSCGKFQDNLVLYCKLTLVVVGHETWWGSGNESLEPLRSPQQYKSKPHISKLGFRSESSLDVCWWTLS
jgi:hypothetical protein